ncbi:hypothetical protein GPL15_10220 [Clostridium sp. MCC353]|uniref:type II toxin-antitoxin system HicB family antitoxin n=1 Tax=Clostridium sp. MCC353 TaxID=2592646 RepID=UPI001C02BCD3|nr:type II toxin-antitoxin system HicB family antitoxin [Clostridium sp. MCC353]MBT9776879.1 hypothetical protein [Clostridium sp. MCC353]
MKTIDEYMKLPYKMEIIEDSDEGGYIVSYPELKGCITCADTLENAIANIKNAKQAWLEAAIETGCVIPEPDDLEKYSGRFRGGPGKVFPLPGPSFEKYAVIRGKIPIL